MVIADGEVCSYRHGCPQTSADDRVALAFGFFELLLRSGDPNRIGMEHARITSLNGVMESVGFQSYIYEDFAEATFDLFSALGSMIPSGEAQLLNTFNDAGLSDSIVTHFKVDSTDTPLERRC
jgi:ubiquitin thioesterase protein OTUB1